ncbi:MAG: CopG family transcriptional regulator [Mesorhizobium sp.]|uniref:CopG family transcriptional regulator n=1 Tax=Mesorhizobium sp. TaxID=1871066 RepID=UPI000FE98599|nr:CopG family transcriptional regulator [Mesorhizobium sp.]RWP16396.1 MAG: CopG family transcriptional regulator [Mesorhizobium sp.]
MATSIRLSPEVEQRLDFLPAKTGRSKARRLLERIRRGEGTTVKAEDFWRGDV